MKSIDLDNIVNGDYSFKELFDEYNSLKLSIKDSEVKVKELKSFISDSNYKKYELLKSNNDTRLEYFLLENPLLSEYLDELQYNKLLKHKLNNLLIGKVDLLKLSNGTECKHEFIKLNNKLLCIKCFIKEEELNYQYDDLCSFLIDIANAQGMYIDEVDENELDLLEKARNDFKNLINNLKTKKENSEEVVEMINNLEMNRTNEYRKSLSILRKKKLSMKK